MYNLIVIARIEQTFIILFCLTTVILVNIYTALLREVFI